MRIVAGTLKGRRIVAPPGGATRPTSDRVREALFSVLASRFGGVDDAVVLDLFAGSGALGIEALSRGAARAVFVEADTAAVQAIWHNIHMLGLDDRASVIRTDALRLDPRRLRDGPFSLLLADPPYRIEPRQVFRTFAALAAAGCLTTGAVVVYECASSAAVCWPDGFAGAVDKRYGSARLAFATWRGSGDR